MPLWLYRNTHEVKPEINAAARGEDDGVAEDQLCAAVADYPLIDKGLWRAID